MTGRKDSLSINLEFVKVSLSRMRRTGGPTFLESFIPTKGGKMDTTLINISGTTLHILHILYNQHLNQNVPEEINPSKQPVQSVSDVKG